MNTPAAAQRLLPPLEPVSLVCVCPDANIFCNQKYFFSWSRDLASANHSSPAQMQPALWLQAVKYPSV